MPTRTIRRNIEAPSLQQVSEPLRVGFDCGRHHSLPVTLMQTATAACSSRCTYWLGAVHHRLTRRVALTLLTILTLAHPLLHSWEGGALDSLMVALLARASHE